MKMMIKTANLHRASYVPGVNPRALCVQLVLIICGFHSCEFIYWLKFNCKSQMNNCCVLGVISGHVQNGEKLEWPEVHVSS